MHASLVGGAIEFGPPRGDCSIGVRRILGKTVAKPQRVDLRDEFSW